MAISPLCPHSHTCTLFSHSRSTSLLPVFITPGPCSSGSSHSRSPSTNSICRSRVRIILDFATWIVDRQRAEAAPVEPAVTGQQPFALGERCAPTMKSAAILCCDPPRLR